MNIAYSITYTIYSPAMRLHVECQSWLYRTRPLTAQGAQRIIRRDRPNAIVTRVEKLSVQP